ncbi:MAG: hypothetical protein K2N84_00535 [Clostridia bacterium]|nr:hypothetical protein [Clostridia bacterium]
MAYDDKDGRRPHGGQNGYGQGYGQGYGYGGSPYGYGNPYGNYANPFDYDNSDYDEDDEEKRHKDHHDHDDEHDGEHAENAEHENGEHGASPEDEMQGVPPEEKKHLSRKEQKELEKRQYEYEKKLVKEGKIAPRIHYKPHHTFGRILAICLTFFFGIFMALGGIIGGIYIAGTQTKLKNVMNMTGIDADAFLTESAQEMSLLQLVDEVRAEIELLGSFNEFSLGTLAKYTPIVEDQLPNYLGELAELGITIDAAALMEVKFANLGEYLKDDVVKAIALADIVEAFSTDDALMHALCYHDDDTKVTLGEIMEGPKEFFEGIALADVFPKEDGEIDPVMNALLYDREGNKYKLGDLISNGTDIIQGVEVETLLGVDGNTNAAIRYLAYGTEFDDDGNANYTVDPETGEVTMREGLEKRTVKTLTDEDVDLLGGARLRDLTNIDSGSSGMMQAMKDWTVDELHDQAKIESLIVGDVFDMTGDEKGLMGAISGWSLKELQEQHRIERLKISQVINLGDSPSALLNAIGQWRIRDLNKQEKIDSLTIADVITIDASSPLLLQSLKDAPLGELGDTVNSLRLSDILSEDDLTNNKILRNLKMSTLNTLSSDVQNLSVADVFGEEIYSYLDVAATKASYEAAKASHTSDDIGVIATGTYAELIAAYEKNKKFKDLSEVVPHAVKPAAGESIESYRVPTTEANNANPTRLELGYFLQDGGSYTLADAKKVSHKNGGYTMEHKLALTAEYSWFTVDFSTGNGVTLPTGDSVTAGDDGYVYHTGDDEYPVLEDGFGFYYKNDNKRVDLEREIVSYKAGDTSYPVTSGKITYAGQSYTVRKDDSGNYILLQIPVTPYYYAPTSAQVYTTVYTEEQTTLRHVLVSGGTEKVLDRYLSGVWYLLLGGEQKETDGSVTVIDNSHSTVLDIGDKIATAADMINTYTLGDLYLHGFITKSPYRDIQSLHFGSFENLNELSIAEVIDLIDNLLGRIGA